MNRVREFDESLHLVMSTRKGVVKKTNLSAFRNIRKDGIIAIKIDDGDHLIEVKLTSGENEVILTTHAGMSIRFDEGQLRDQGRATRGVRGITLAKEDHVESMDIVNGDATFLVCTENGYGKRSSFDDYRMQRRGGKGIIAIRTSDRNGQVVGAHTVLDSDSLMLISAQGKMIRMAASDVRVIGRATQGVRLINLDAGDQLVAASPLEHEEGDGMEEEAESSAKKTSSGVPEIKPLTEDEDAIEVEDLIEDDEAEADEEK
jgi:DNA gyrase subunit A